VLVIFNPVAGRRRAGLLWQVLDLLAENGVKVEIARTRHGGHASDLARDAVAAGRSMVVAAGGDGTIAEVAAGLTGSAVPLGIIPMGTANVLAHELRLPFSPRDIAAALAFRRTRPLLPGLARSAQGGERQFVQMLGAGFDAQVVHRIGPRLKRAMGRSAYAVQGMRELSRYRYPRLHLRIDGAHHTAASMIVCKGKLYGGNYLLAADADHATSGFSVVLFDRGGPFSASLYGLALPLGALPRAPGLRFLRGHQIDLLNAEGIPVQADGDRAGMGPLTISDARAPIDVIVSR